MSKNIYIFLLLIIYFSFQLSNSENNFSKDNEYEENKRFINNLNYTNILYLNDSNFTSIINKNNITYVLFYLSTCKYCKKFMPIFIETANYFKEKKLNVMFARIETNINPKTTEEYNAFIEPAIFLIIKGRKYTFEGEKTKEGLLKFFRKKINDNIFKITKLNEIYEYTNTTSLVFLSTIKNTSLILYKSFIELAEFTNDYDFISCLSDECLNKYGEDIILFKNFDEKENSYKKDYGNILEANEESLNNFISIYGIECGAYLDLYHINLIEKYEKQAIIYVRNESNYEQIKYDKLFKKLGKELRNKNIYTFISNIDDNGETNIKEAFSIIPEELPCVFFYNQNANDPFVNVKIYSLRNINLKHLTIEFLKNFIKNVNNEKIKRDLLSEHPSKNKIVNGLKYVIGKSFDKDVINEKRNVFLALIEDEEKNNNKLFLDIMRNISNKYENTSFAYINVNNNEPRDLPVRGEILPLGYLYTNAMDEKIIIKFEFKNINQINEKEVIIFLDEIIKKAKYEKHLIIKAPENKNLQTDL